VNIGLPLSLPGGAACPLVDDGFRYGQGAPDFRDVVDPQDRGAFERAHHGRRDRPLEPVLGLCVRILPMKDLREMPTSTGRPRRPAPRGY